MNYIVKYKASAFKEHENIHEPFLSKIKESILDLQENSRPIGCRKLVGGELEWRIKVGDYRIVYEINDDEKLVRIFRIRHRKDAYR